MRKYLLNACLAVMMWLAGASAWAIGYDGDPIQIGSAADLKAFAELVNKGENGSNFAYGVLTADIDYGTESTMIGRDGMDFQGCLDGQGHTITINMYGSGNGQALFRNIGINGRVKNLCVKGKITTEYKYAAGIAAWSTGTITNCFVDIEIISNIPGDGTHAGIAAVTYKGSVIANSLAKIHITGSTTTNCGGIIGWTDNRTVVENCLAINDIDIKEANGSATIGRNAGNIKKAYNNFFSKEYGDQTAGTFASEEDLKSGKICFLLNHDQQDIHWTQNIGEDPYPVPNKTRKQVYCSAATACDGTTEDATATYSNTPGGTPTPHNLKNGCCQTCTAPISGGVDVALEPGYMVPDYVERDQNGFFMVKNADDFMWLRQIHALGNEDFGVKMVNDIDLGDNPEWLNNNNWYSGYFDGQFHTLTIHIGAGATTSIMPNFSGDIYNIVIAGDITAGGKQYAGAVTSHTRNANRWPSIRNVVSAVDITSDLTGDGTHGGFIGVNEVESIMENCIFVGSISSENTSNCGGIIGWCGSPLHATKIVMAGNMNVADGDNNVIARHDTGLRSNENEIFYTGGQGAVPGAAVLIDASTLGSGELAYMLNGDQSNVTWFQTLPGDDYPVPFGSHKQVYANPSDGYRCDGLPLGNVTYSNTESEVVLPDHVYVEGFCENCQKYDTTYELTPNEDGFCEIANGRDLAVFSHMVTDNLKCDANAILTADIDVTEEENALFAIIARSEDNPYVGHFDGQGHTISNLIINTVTKGVGLIGSIAGPAIVENLKLDKSCKITGDGYVGLVGFSTPAGGTVTIRNVGNEADVTSTNGANAGGVLGCCMNSAATIIMENCYSTGKINGPTENGAISGWVGGSATLRNCWSTSEVTGLDGDNYFYRGTASTNENNYCKNGKQVNALALTDEMVESGELAWKLNGSQWITPAWFQTLGEDAHPEPLPSHGVVYLYNGQYGSIYDEASFNEARQAFKDGESAYIDQEDFYAQTDLTDAYRDAIENLDNLTETAELAQAMKDLMAQKETLSANANAYNKYIARAKELTTECEQRTDFEGEFRDILENYLNGDAEPSEEYPNGQYYYIIDTQELSTEQITAELAFLEEMFSQAVKYGYTPGSDITSLLVNPKFDQAFTVGWEGTMGSGKETHNLSNGTFTGAESWSTNPFDMHQTITGLKNGYYLLQMNAAARPSSEVNTMSLNYTASIYANSNVNYIMTAKEAIISVDDAVDGVTANITGNVADYAVYDEDDEETVIGYMPHGMLSTAIMANADRAKNYIVAEVTDGTLTVGIKNRHSHRGNDWTGFANTKLTYLGEAEDDATGTGLDLALQGQVDRANTILFSYEPAFDTDYAVYPNFNEEMKAELAAQVEKAETATTVEEKYAIIEKISELFEQIYDCKQAYASMISSADLIEAVSVPLQKLISEDDYNAMGKAYSDIWDAYMDGSYTIEQALNPQPLEAVEKYIPEQDENGVYQIADKFHMIYFAAAASTVDQKAKGVMLNDIDMTDVEYSSIGTDDKPFGGSFDGQGHKFSNLIINGTTRVGLFGYVAGGMTLKNLVLDNTCEINATSGGYAGIIGCSDDGTTGTITMQQLGNEGKVYANGPNAGGIIGVNMGSTASFLIENCYVTGEVTGNNESGAITGWSGGGQSTIRNCWSTATVTGYDAGKPFYRHDDTVVENCYNLTGEQATKMTWEQLKSGEIAYKLNGSSSENPVWFETLGTDTIPHLFNGDIVYYYAGEYGNEKPVIELNSFAYNMQSASNENEATIYYTLNSPAKSGKIDFYAGETKVYTEELSGDQLAQGDHAVAVENSKLGENGTEITFQVTIESLGVLTPSAVGKSEKFWAPYGMAINNLPESKTFGTALVAESSTHPKNTGYVSDAREGHQGIYAYTPQLESIAANDGIVGFTGGLTLNSEGPLRSKNYSGFEPKTIRISEDGRLFIGLMGGNQNSPIYEGKLDDLNADWTPLFTGGTLDQTTGLTMIGDEMQAGLMISFDVEGKGDNLKLYTLMADTMGTNFAVEHYYARTYDLGTKTEWNTVPSSVYEPLDSTHWTISPAPVNVVSDRRGGLWYIQYRANPTAALPALKHFNTAGVVDYSNINRAQPGGGMAISADGSMVAIPTGNNTVSIYRVDYQPNEVGMITMVGVATVSTVDGAQLTALAFDYAYNLWAASNSSETLTRYVVPGLLPENTVVTPSNAEAKFTVGSTKTGIQKVENDGKNVIYTIGGVRVEKAQKGVNIVNGKKVLVK